MAIFSPKKNHSIKQSSLDMTSCKDYSILNPWLSTSVFCVRSSLFCSFNEISIVEIVTLTDSEPSASHGMWMRSS